MKITKRIAMMMIIPLVSASFIVNRGVGSSTIHTRSSSSSSSSLKFHRNCRHENTMLGRHRERFHYGTANTANIRWNSNRRCEKDGMKVGVLSSSLQHSDLAVSLNQPLLSAQRRAAPASSNTSLLFFKSVLSVMMTDAFKTAALAFIVAFSLSVVLASSPSIRSKLLPSSSAIASTLQENWKRIKGKFSHLFERFCALLPKLKREGGVGVVGGGIPMTFSGEGGWGVCTLISKKQILPKQDADQQHHLSSSSSCYYEYEFALPKKDYTLPLALGQQLTLCCLDDNNQVAKGDFFTFSPRFKKGSFSIVLPLYSGKEEQVSFQLGQDRANFARVVETELDVGDEVALKPGKSTLDYRGPYLPITDMIYITSNLGIVPVLPMVKAVLPPDSSTVENVNVIWVNDDVQDFDLAFSELEKDFHKYSRKLDVSCILVDDLRNDESYVDNSEMEQAIPEFSKGSMVVLSGPELFLEKVGEYLRNSKNYPENCVCVLP